MRRRRIWGHRTSSDTAMNAVQVSGVVDLAQVASALCEGGCIYSRKTVRYNLF